MEALATTFLTIAAALLALPVAVLLVEIIPAAASRQRDVTVPANPFHKERPRTAVVIPAHNESGGLVATLQDIKQQLRPDDRLLVVADNCTDETAAVAAACGAEVV